MSELLPITITSIILALLSHFFSKYDKLNNRYERKERLFYSIMAVAMVLFVGLRTGYNDTGTYRDVYNVMYVPNNILHGIEWTKIGENPGFDFANRVLKTLGFSAQSFLMFYAAITVGIYLWFLRKYSCDLPLTIFLFVTYAGYIFTCAAIKQCMAMALCLLATDRAIRKRYVAFVLWILAACLFHPYALMYLIVPFMMFRPWGYGTVLMLALFALVGFSLQRLTGTIVDVTTLLGENFDAESFTGEGVNPIRMIVTAVPVLVSFITSSVIARKNDRVQNLMLNLTMLNAEIMFVALFGTANYFARLANYFLTFQALSIPWLFTHFEPKSRKLITWIAVACYALFFVYSQAIHERFDGGYSSITLWKYLQSLFV